jgi:hypothetical protein
MEILRIFRVILTLILSLVFWNSSLAQREVLQLNEHFYELEFGGGRHTYNKLVSYTSKGEKIEKVYTLENKPIRITNSFFKDSEEKQIHWKQIQDFDDQGNLISIEITDATSEVVKTIVSDGEKIILELECKEVNSDCKGTFYPTSTTDSILVESNILKPDLGGVEVWNKHLMKNLKYPLSARKSGEQGTVWCGLEIDEEGLLIEVLPMNSGEVHQDLVKEVERVIRLYKGDIKPAMDFQGNKKRAWMYLPVRFKLG